MSTNENLQIFAESISFDKKHLNDKRKIKIMKALRKYIKGAGVDGKTELLEILKLLQFQRQLSFAETSVNSIERTKKRRETPLPKT